MFHLRIRVLCLQVECAYPDGALICTKPDAVLGPYFPPVSFFSASQASFSPLSQAYL
jgi:hypothetical protein